MADYSEIQSIETDPEAPPTANLFKRLEENPRAIAEGAPGAPPVLYQALGDDVEAGAFLAWEAANNISVGTSTIFTSHQTGTLRIQFSQQWTGNTTGFSTAVLTVGGVNVGSWNAFGNTVFVRTMDAPIARGDTIQITHSAAGSGTTSGTSVVSGIMILTNGQLLLPLAFGSGIFTLP